MVAAAVADGAAVVADGLTEPAGPPLQDARIAASRAAVMAPRNITELVTAADGRRGQRGSGRRRQRSRDRRDIVSTRAWRRAVGRRRAARADPIAPGVRRPYGFA